MLKVASEAAGVGRESPCVPSNHLQHLRGGVGHRDLARGPGRLTQAMQVDLRQDSVDPCAAGPLWLATSGAQNGRYRQKYTHRVDAQHGPEVALSTIDAIHT